MQQFKTLELAIAQYHQIKNLKFKGEIRDQIERAALSVCLNLSEGNAKSTTKDRKRFFNISYASQKEIQTLLLIEGIIHLQKDSDIIAACIYRLHERAL